MLAIEVEDGLFFPLFEPEIAGNPTVVLVDRAVTPAPGARTVSCKTPDPDLSIRVSRGLRFERENRCAEPHRGGQVVYVMNCRMIDP